MSSIPPSMPPGPPNQPYPPYPPYPPKKKTSPVVWILLGIGIFLMLIMCAVVGLGFFVGHKIKQAGLDTDLLKRNPALATVKMMAALNPNIEIVSMDENKGMVTVREKQTGKTYTVDFEDAKKGKFVLQEDGKKPVTVTTSGDDKTAAFEVKSSEGNFKVGSGAGAKVPTWIPDYPGSTPVGAFSAQTADGNSGSYGFTTKDSIDKVSKFYEDGLKASGMKTSSTIGRSDGNASGGMISGEAGNKSAVVLIGSEHGDTSVSVTFKAGK